ncbi:hypothetical protein BC628DRAFT_1374472 [Trametes gibbosa]|nr:hypothetical protein BC628DRAFT_1374472 [Trametes gibbosa]
MASVLRSQCTRRCSALLVVLGSFLVILSLHLSLSTESLVISLKGSSWHYATPYTTLGYEHLRLAADEQVGEENKILGIFSEVLVVSRPSRMDRRATMERLRLALNVPFTYVDATSHDDPVIGKIIHCVQLVRQKSLSRIFHWPPNLALGTVNGLPLTETFSCFPHMSAIWQTAHTTYPVSRYASTLDVPTSVTFDLRDTPLSRPPATPLTCAVEDHTLGVQYTSTTLPHMLLTHAKIACWYSHLTAILRVAASGEVVRRQSVHVNSRDPILILEDDIDMEQDISDKIRSVWAFLPSDWDIVFLGHCWSNETYFPAVPGQVEAHLEPRQVTLHPSYAPKCTHAYAINPASANRLLLHLSFPHFAYSRALDQALAWLVQSKRVKAFSVVPSVIIQHKGSGSDIDEGVDGMGSRWRDQLAHGILGL